MVRLGENEDVEVKEHGVDKEFFFAKRAQAK